VSKLSDVFSERFGGYWGKEPGKADLDVRAIRNGDVGTTGELKWANLPTRGFTAREAKKAAVRGGDILLTTSGNCGSVAFVRCDPPVATAATNFVRVLRVDANRVDPRYAFRFLQSPRFQRGITPFVRGATIKNLSVEAALDTITLSLPTLSEQRRIATILDHADAIRTKRRQVLAHVNTLTQSVFHAMFGETAATTTVDEIATVIRTGPFGSQLLKEEFVDDGIAVLGLDNVVSNEFRWVERRYITTEKYEKLTRYTVHPGDVLISIMGTTGRCVVVPDNIPTAINTKHICAITPDRDRLDPDFLRAAFLWHAASREHLRRQTKGSIMAGLNMGIIKSMPIPIPPMDLQHEFAERVEAINTQRATVERALAADDELFASLQSHAFRGEL